MKKIVVALLIGIELGTALVSQRWFHIPRTLRKSHQVVWKQYFPDGFKAYWESL